MKNSCIILAIFLFQTGGFSQGKLNKTKTEISKEKTDKKQSSIASNGVNALAYDNTSQSDGLILSLLYHASVGLLIGNYNSEAQLNHPLTSYPFKKEVPGNYTKNNHNSKYTQFRVDIMNQLMAGTNMTVNHLKVRIRPTHILFVQADYTEFMEPRIDDTGTDNLSLFNFSICHDRIRYEKFNLGWTLGVLYIPNSIEKVGGNLGFQMEYFWNKRLSILSAIKWGWINETNINEFETTLRYHLKRSFISSGYERRKLGSSTIHVGGMGVGIYL